MINGPCYKNALISGANNISRHKKEIDSLNIFPVPDGDTGTNMSMTISAAVTALEEMNSMSVADVSAAAASAMLKGARGNSGVILSLLFKGMSNGMKDHDEVDGKIFISSLKLGVDIAYNAVMNPTEGTILTVARMACEAGKIAADVESDPVIVLSAVCSAAREALEKTPEMLPVLKKAGVVDAGGKGLCLIFEGMLSLLRDGIMINIDSPVHEQVQEDNTEDFFKNAAAEFDAQINFTYCTEFIIEKKSEISKSPFELKAYLETIGDCVLVAEDSNIIKVHVHTENPGKALEEALTFGQLLTVKIENMKEQHRKAAEEYEKEKAKKEEAEKKLEELKSVPPTEDVGFVAVASGSGIEKAFKELGCRHIVVGGQSMNPSTDDIYKAVMATPARNVFVFPNNKNILLAAEQVVSLVTDRNVIVIPTRTIPQGLSALLSYTSDSTPELNQEYMTKAAKSVSTGQVTYAARNSEFGNAKIKEGEVIAFNNGKLSHRDKDPVHAAIKLAKEMINRDTSYVTVIYGEEISESQANLALQAIKSKAGSNVEVTLINGAQPIYYFILSVE